MRHLTFCLAGGALALLSHAPLQAQMIHGSAGVLHDADGIDKTYAWRIDYRRPIGGQWLASLGWLNEGHLPNHHRDGSVLELWRYWQVKPGRFLIVGGAGLYRYYDTAPAGSGYVNEHGYRGLLTVGAWYLWGQDRTWVSTIDLNRTVGGSEPQTQSVLVGLGYRIGRPLGDTPATPEATAVPALHRSLNLYAGQSILNSLHSESSIGYQVEYRQNITPRFEWSVAYSNGGDLEEIRREGVVGQAWISGWFREQRLHLGFGAGPYFYREGHPNPLAAGDWDFENRTGWRATLTAGHRVFQRGIVRLAWNRTFTTNSRDSDLITLGLGYGW